MSAFGGNLRATHNLARNVAKAIKKAPLPEAAPPAKESGRGRRRRHGKTLCSTPAPAARRLACTKSRTLSRSPARLPMGGKDRMAWRYSRRSVRSGSGIVQNKQVNATSREQVIRDLLSTSWTGVAQVIGSPSDIDAVGHRIVHGGPHFEDPAVMTPDVRKAIARVSAFAPLHIDAELEGVRTVENLLGAVPQVAVFDTGFHRQMPLPAAIYPGPYEWFESGIRRYGFHGINHQHCGERAAQLLGKDKEALKVVTCHLGNGCSVAAVHGGRSVDTTMGFTPLDGLMMGTRSGAVDPGILTFLMRQGQLDAKEIDGVLNHKSGLLGISGISEDMRDILAAIGRGHERAKLASTFTCIVCERRSRLWQPPWGEWMYSCLRPGWARIPRNTSRRLRWTGFSGCSAGCLQERATKPRRGCLFGEFAGPGPRDSGRGGLGDRERVLEALARRTTGRSGMEAF